MCLSLKIAGVWLLWQLSGRCRGLSAGCWPSRLPGNKPDPGPMPATPPVSGCPEPSQHTRAQPCQCALPNLRSLQHSPIKKQKCQVWTQINVVRKKNAGKVKNILQTHMDGDKWNLINDASFPSILMSCGKEISIANPALSLTEISEP